jgi:hypothetical protein
MTYVEAIIIIGITASSIILTAIGLYAHFYCEMDQIIVGIIVFLASATLVILMAAGIYALFGMWAQ